MASQKIQKAFMWFLQRLSKLLLTHLLSTLGISVYAQVPIVQNFNKDSIHSFRNAPFNKSKQIPPEYSQVINITLSYYPELANTRIQFKIRKQKSPLVSRPALLSIFRRASKRRYIVAISNKTTPQFTPILLANLGFNAQIGVIGHELSHVSDYNTHMGIYFIGMALKSINSRNTDKHEYRTDERCINHGLGYQLLSWSVEVREKLHLSGWSGVSESGAKDRERYMNPNTIKSFIKANEIYN